MFSDAGKPNNGVTDTIGGGPHLYPLDAINHVHNMICEYFVKVIIELLAGEGLL